MLRMGAVAVLGGIWEVRSGFARARRSGQGEPGGAMARRVLPGGAVRREQVVEDRDGGCPARPEE